MGRFYTLDLMRGVAAIAVMLYHADRIVPRGYLAVDLFFVLSGFVLLRAYGPRLAQGEIGPVLFRRAVRLGPLMLAGVVVGFAINGFPPNDHGFLFPANIPLWSLAFEVVASVAFILLFRFGAIVWAIAWTAGFYFTLLGILEHHTADLGYRWETAGYGLARTAFSFCTGLAIARFPVRRVPSWFAVPLVALAISVTMLPATAPAIADIVAVLLLFPACIALAVKFDAPLVRFASWLGAASYALYAIHHPIVKWAVETDAALWPTLIVLPFAALALERFYDRPMRNWLSDAREHLRTAETSRFGQRGDAGSMGQLSKSALIAGYATVALLAVLPSLAVFYLAGSFDLRGDPPPFAVFAFAFALLICALWPLRLLWQRHPAPLRQLRADIATHKYWLLSTGFMLLVLPQTLDAAMHIKRLIPYLQPFYADDFLIRLDRVLFLGHDGWEVTHAILGTTATRILDAIYGLWHVGQIGLAMLIVLTADRRFQLRAALSFQVAWVLMGGALAVAFASVGPCFVDDFFGSDHFASLMNKLAAIDGLHSTKAAMGYLIDAQGTNAIGSGISAMPSLHVAIAVLIGLVVRDRWPRWQWAAWTFAAIIFVGSIHLAWHYASDGLVSGLGMLLIWWASGRYLDWLNRTAEPAQMAPAAL